MRYQSFHVPEEKQETTAERAERQRQERRAELNYTEEDNARWEANRKRVEERRQTCKVLEDLGLAVDVSTISELKDNLYPIWGENKYDSYISRFVEESNPNLAKDGPLTLPDLQWLKECIDSGAIARFKQSLEHVKTHEASGVPEFDAKYLVSKELMKTESVFLSHGISSEIKVVVTKDNVTTYLTYLDGVPARGHPNGGTWNSVPGAGAPDGKPELVIALKQDKDGKWELPSGNHGSSNLVLHEFGHALDKVIGNKVDKKQFSQSPEFYRCWYNDFTGGNIKDPYYAQPANNYSGGLEETFAEGFAKYYGSNDNNMTLKEWPWVVSYFHQTLLPKLKEVL